MTNQTNPTDSKLILTAPAQTTTTKDYTTDSALHVFYDYYTDPADFGFNGCFV